MIGQKLSHFKITSKLGAGGMGEVYRAEDTKLGRDVAIKVLPAEVADDPQRLERFAREAKAVAALNHPNIVTVYSVEEAGGVHFMAMELVKGETLTRRIPEDGMPLDDFWDIAVPLADALGAAHDQGITHRDLKPDNVMVTTEGRVKVLDFGLAKLVEDEPLADSSIPTATRSPQLTEEGAVLGTVAYMSPEQAEGKPLDSRTDIFSLGGVLYQALTGVPPFQGDSRAGLVSALLRDNPPRLPQVRPGLPPDLDRILRKCMSKNREWRYGSAKELRIDLEMARREFASAGPAEASAASPAAASPPPKSVGREKLAWGAVAVLLVAVAALGYLLTRQSTPAPAPQLLRIATGPPPGVYHPVGTGIGDAIERDIDGVRIEVLITDGSFENVRMLDRGQADLAIVQNDVAFNAVKTDLVLGKRNTDILGLALFYQEVAQVVVRTDLPAHSIRDLAGLRVNIGLPNSGNRFSSTILLSHFGLAEGDFEASLLDVEDSAGALIDGSLDAMVIWRAIPTPFFQQMFESGAVRMLSIDHELVAGLRMNQPFFTPVTIPPGVYPNQPDPISTVAVKSMLVASRSVEPQVVTRILETLFASIPDLIAHHQRAGDISLETAYRLEDGMPIDLHPGAIAFYAKQSAR